jgi:endo-beta-N-acetylglucosaminidase D
MLRRTNSVSSGPIVATGVLLIALLWPVHASAQSPGQPFASFWFRPPHDLTDLLTWTPDSDPDAAFNRANTPLAARSFNPDFNVNPHAHPGEARVMSLVGFHPTSNNPSQGELSVDYYAINYWQYIDVLVFFGGSSSEGLILAPNPPIIDAAHRNGVPVLGCIFFPNANHIDWVRLLVQQSGSSFPAADKLIEIAHYYGFDGWFINQESTGGDAMDALQVRRFMQYIKGTSDLMVAWYDAMNTTGSVGYQNQLNDFNAPFFQEGDTPTSDGMFLNYGWNGTLLSNSHSKALDIGRDPHDVYAGVNVQSNGYNTSVNWGAVFPEDQPHVVSLGFYRPEWTFKNCTPSPCGLSDFYQRDNRFWVGANRDPSNTVTTGPWKGLAHYLPAKTPINQLPFVTNFNPGQGHLVAVNGEVRRTGDWNNLSLQDVLPTWRWIVLSSGSALFPDLDSSTAYYGGASLSISGTLDAPNDLPLFQTNLPVSALTQLRIAYKIGAAAVPTNMKLSVAFADDPQNVQYFDVGPTTSADWETQTFSLSGAAGRTIAALGLRFESSDPVSNYAISVGQIALYDGDGGSVAPPANLSVDSKMQIDASRATLRLSWTHSPDAVRYYNVYRRNPDDSLTYLGGTPNNAYFVAEVDRVDCEPSTTIEVEAVGQVFNHSTHASATFDWNE